MGGKKRIEEIDIARFIGICLVALQHSGNLHGKNLDFVMIFIMPLFLTLSGYTSALVKERTIPFKTFLAKKTRVLALPYVYFTFIYIIINFLYQLKNTGSIDFSITKEMIIKALSFYGCSVLWFLSALFFSDLIVQGLLRAAKKLRLLIFTALVILSVTAHFLTNPVADWWYLTEGHSYFEMYLFYLINAVMRLPMCSLYLFAGYFAGSVFRYPRSKNKIRDVILHFIYGAVCYALCYLLAVINDGGNLATFYYGKHLYFYIPASVLGIAGTLFISHALVLTGFTQIIKPLTYLGENSLIILLTHLDFYLLYAAVLLTSNIPVLSFHGITRMPMVLAVMMLIEVPFIILIKKWFPFLIGRKIKKDLPSDPGSKK
ncbi:MAG: acyltransferase [Lachnospiraceae bacterium]|nr:acyltransferase [Lachnospiraceae bacterium]